MSEPGFCRELSIAADEPIAGSAVARISAWLAIEYAGPWSADAVTEADLPASVKAWLEQAEAQVPGLRPQLVRRGEGVDVGTTTVLLASTAIGQVGAVRWRLGDATAAADIDVAQALAQIRARAPVPGTETVARPLVLVCTNGKRDRCCAKWGLAAYQAFARRGTIECWQTTHLGGHRFAATLLWLPHGVCFGRVHAEEVDALADAIEAEEIRHLGRLRGRTCLDPAEQAAEAIWRARTGATAVGDLASVVREGEGDVASVRLRDLSGREELISVSRDVIGTQAAPSCGKPPAPVVGWRARAAG